MQTWVQQAEKTRGVLKKDREARRKQQAEERQPLRVRLEKIISELPAERAEAGLPLKFFIERTPARWRGRNAAARDVATALWALGWTRTRRWRAEYGSFRAFWYPPTTETTETSLKPPHTSCASRPTAGMAVNESTLTDPLAELFSATMS